MTVAIRLSRVGTKHVPFFRMVVVDSRKKRDGAVIEVLGTYDGLKTKLINFKPEKFDEWVKQGAQPSDTAKKIYKLFQLQQAGKLPEKKEKVSKKSVTKSAAPSADAKTMADREKPAPTEVPTETPRPEAPKVETPAERPAEPKPEQPAQPIAPTPEEKPAGPKPEQPEQPSADAPSQASPEATPDTAETSEKTEK